MASNLRVGGARARQHPHERFLETRKLLRLVSNFTVVDESVAFWLFLNLLPSTSVFSVDMWKWEEKYKWALLCAM